MGNEGSVEEGLGAVGIEGGRADDDEGWRCNEVGKCDVDG